MVKKYEGRIINIHTAVHIMYRCTCDLYASSQRFLMNLQSIIAYTAEGWDQGRMDTGPIILQKEVEVEKGDTPEILQRRVMEQAEWIILPKAIQMIAHGEV